MNDLVIETLSNESDITAWNAYVEQSAQATFFHRAEWRDVIKKSFGHSSYYLFAKQNNQIVGVLPLGHVSSWLFGHALISVPFCVYGGVVADNDIIQQALINKAVELAKQLQVDYLELRNQQEIELDGWQEKSLYVTFCKKISDNDDENLKAIPRKQRAMVRKGIKSELTTIVEHSVEDFFTAYSTSVRNLGTPVFPKKYFKVLMETFAEDADIITINDKAGNLVASVLSFYFKDQVLPYYGGGTELARQAAGNDFMYWQLMCHAVKKGKRVFDFGRSKQNTGAYSFKKNWGFTAEPLSYQYYLVKAKSLPNVSPTNPKYQLFIKLWQKLPLAISQLLGPIIAKNLG
ncbi:FemAB family XrtA/PEP-CTERM system-associated protein [Spartinivicinus poritis]|uniref:FemAB family PEP-CTERM system-associated protein n=1 Tax=Spartinivicinus poritis TaxID=2994640 RepID=A0ABT5UDZ8_9GAMM|nr:FemAB family XrtA/PEP-CTERM system-associated protein [Spartinivicinus sp. A2-2]MDE1464606.1 FemAB family PEP-CTERM system-associated protein [Spartinivicinus sp. A2-2]